MFIKSLRISKKDMIIREMTFHKGINLIVDETPIIDVDDTSNEQKTGNNVGKTTVLKLIDFCLGGKASNIYSDAESKRQIYTLVKDYLVDNEVLITLILKSDLNDEKSKEIKIERNFLPRKKVVRRINGKNLTEDDFEQKLTELIFPNHTAGKPSFRQIISHNIRINDYNINNTLKTLDRYTSDAEYETLYLFLLGCVFKEGERKQIILTKIKQENTYKERLEKKQTKTAYEAALSLVEDEIDELNKRKSNLNINENLQKDLETLNNIKYKINQVSSTLSTLNLRKDIILEAEEELKKDISTVDVQQLKIIYKQAANKIDNLQKTFEDLVKYHNTMLFEKIKFITNDLPLLEQQINNKSEKLKYLLNEEKSLSEIVAKSDSFEELEKLISEINEKYRKKGEYETVISQLEEVESNIQIFEKDLNKIDGLIFSSEFEQKVKDQIKKFNKFFASISYNLYGERYALKYDIIVNKKQQRLYKFTSFNANLSSGKKQGEIICFDMAYTLFADDENIPCLHFLLNDKKELMHDNQLIDIAEYIEDKNIQFVASILKDKLPEQLKNEKYYVVKLSQEDKLFRIENNK